MIIGDKSLIDDVFWGSKDVESVYMDKKMIWPSTMKISGVIATQDTLDPDKIFNGAVLNEELEAIIENTHWCAGKLTDEGMVVCQVGDKVLDLKTFQTGDLSSFYNGETRWSKCTAGGTKVWPYGDMFIRFPKFSVVKNVIDEDTAQLKWVYGAEINDWVYWDGSWLIGLSSCGYDFGKIHCHANVHDMSTKFDVWKERLSKMDERYGFMTYWQRCIFTHLYWSIYGTTRDVLTGSPHYFLGIDAFCSDWTEYMDGIVVNNRVPIITNPDGTTRIGPTLPGTGGLGAGGWISKIFMTSHLDILPKEYGASATSGYCSYAWTSNNNECIPRAKAGMSTSGEMIGVGYDRTGNDDQGKAAVRLTYHGKIIETKDVEYFKRLKPINGGIFYNDETGQDEYYNPYV